MASTTSDWFVDSIGGYHKLSYCDSASAFFKGNYYGAYASTCDTTAITDSWKIYKPANLKYTSYNVKTSAFGAEWYDLSTYKATITSVMNQTAQQWYTYQCDERLRRRSKTPEERLREIIQSRQGPLIITSRQSIQPATDIREVRARQTLRRIIGDEEMRDYLKNGFVSVQAKSGLVYQIYPSHGITKVYSQGQMTERLCVVLKGDFPPTDSLIMRYLLIVNDEQDFRRLAIRHQIMTPKPKAVAKPDQRSLTEIYSKLKMVG